MSADHVLKAITTHANACARRHTEECAGMFVACLSGHLKVLASKQDATAAEKAAAEAIRALFVRMQGDDFQPAPEGTNP